MEYSLMNVIQIIVSVTGLSIEDAKKRVLDKQKEFENLISEEGAAYIVAKELGLKFVKNKGEIVKRFEKNEQMINELNARLDNLKGEIKINKRLLDEL